MDEYQCLKRQTNELLRHTDSDLSDPDYFEFETHIMFDDAMTWNGTGERSVNGFVKELTRAVKEVGSEIYGNSCKFLYDSNQ